MIDPKAVCEPGNEAKFFVDCFGAAIELKVEIDATALEYLRGKTNEEVGKIAIAMAHAVVAKASGGGDSLTLAVEMLAEPLPTARA